MVLEEAIQTRLRPGAFARDLALVGSSTAFALALVQWMPLSTVLLTVGFAAIGGAVLGALAPRLLHWRVRRKPLVFLIPAVFGLGACWGGASAALAAWITEVPWIRPTELGMSAGAVQLGALWLPYVLQRVHDRAAWPIVAAACFAAPIVGYLAYVHVTWT